MTTDELAAELREVHIKSRYNARTANAIMFGMEHSEQISGMGWHDREMIIRKAGVPGSYNDWLRVGAVIARQTCRPQYLFVDE